MNISLSLLAVAAVIQTEAGISQSNNAEGIVIGCPAIPPQLRLRHHLGFCAVKAPRSAAVVQN